MQVKEPTNAKQNNTLQQKQNKTGDRWSSWTSGNGLTVDV